jgi:putative transposase
MRKSRFSEAQIIGKIKEQEAGMPTAEVCRKHGLSQGTFYKYKSKYGGMEVSDVAKLRAMEDENARLKRLLADTMPSSRSNPIAAVRWSGICLAKRASWPLPRSSTIRSSFARR